MTAVVEAVLASAALLARPVPGRKCSDGPFAAGAAAGRRAVESAHHARAAQSFMSAGPKMTETVLRVPLALLYDDDAGLKGGIYYAASRAR